MKESILSLLFVSLSERRRNGVFNRIIKKCKNENTRRE